MHNREGNKMNVTAVPKPVFTTHVYLKNNTKILILHHNSNSRRTTFYINKVAPTDVGASRGVFGECFRVFREYQRVFGECFRVFEESPRVFDEYLSAFRACQRREYKPYGVNLLFIPYMKGKKISEVLSKVLSGAFE